MTRAPVERRPAEKARPAKKRGDTPPMTKGNMQVRVVSLAALSAPAICNATAAAVRGGSAPRCRMRFFRVPPGRYSMAM